MPHDRPTTSGARTLTTPSGGDASMLLFDPFAPLHPRTGAFLAPVDVAVGEKEVVLTFDLPGLTQEDLDVHVFDTQLVLRGSRSRGELRDGMSFAHVERPSG